MKLFAVRSTTATHDARWNDKKGGEIQDLFLCFIFFSLLLDCWTLSFHPWLATLAQFCLGAFGSLTLHGFSTTSFFRSFLAHI